MPPGITYGHRRAGPHGEPTTVDYATSPVGEALRANDADQLRSRADERVEDYRGQLEPREADQLPVPTPTLIAAAGPALRARRGAPG